MNELGFEKIRKHFNFLRFFFGKAFFCLFLGLMCFNRHKWFSWACSVLFFISAFFYIMLSVTFMKDERKKLNEIMNDTNSVSDNSSRDIRDVEIKQKH